MPAVLGKEKSLESIVNAEEMIAQFAFLVKGFIVSGGCLFYVCI